MRMRSSSLVENRNQPLMDRMPNFWESTKHLPNKFMQLSPSLISIMLSVFYRMYQITQYLYDHINTKQKHCCPSSWWGFVHTSHISERELVRLTPYLNLTMPWQYIAYIILAIYKFTIAVYVCCCSFGEGTYKSISNRRDAVHTYQSFGVFGRMYFISLSTTLVALLPNVKGYVWT